MATEHRLHPPTVEHTIRSHCEACQTPLRTWRGICDDCIEVAKRAHQCRYDPALDCVGKAECKVVTRG